MENKQRPAPPESRRFVYEVDSADRIRSVSPDWEAFARENGAPELHSAAVVGRPLLDFLVGDEVQQLYLMLMARVRETGEPVDLPFRCDGPTMRRWMRLRIARLGRGRLRFEGRIERRAAREPVALFDRDAPRSTKALVTVCSWCKRVRVAGEWVEVEIAIERLGMFEREPVPGLTHGICAACVPVLKPPVGEVQRGHPDSVGSEGPAPEPA